MNEAISNLFGNWLTLGLIVIVCLLSLIFVWQVAIRGFVLLRKLGKARSEIKALDPGRPVENKAALARLFKQTAWEPLWKEFEDTLHEQHDTSGPETRVAGVRATVPADAFFHVDALVDGPLHVEFYRHLPGILTGIGIIGTFMGLISGLLSFDASATDPAALKQSLGGLFRHVREAFLFSAMAIGLAMLFTIFEKVIYAICVHHANGLAMAIDALFKSGVGEEYLSKLVDSSEESSTQTRQLKESLVEDLKAMLTNLTERQVAATQQLSLDIGRSLETSLESPLNKIAEVVRAASGEQSSSAASMLENLMASFMAQMRETLGGQLGDLGGLMQQTASSMGQVELAMRGLVADMQQASESSSVGVRSAMQELLASLSEHQRQQDETASQGQSRLLGEMNSAIAGIAAAQQDASARALDAARNASDSIGGAAASAIKASDQSVQAATALLASLEGVSMQAIQGLEQGAARINAVLGSLGGVTDRLSTAGAALVGLQDKAVQAAGSLERASTNLGVGSQEVSKSMEAIGQLATRLDGVGGLMVSEAQTRESTLKELQQIIQRSQEASQQFGKLSQDVQAHLEDGVSRFGKATHDVLDKSLSRFDKELSDAADLLAGSMQQLAAIVNDFKPNRGS